MAAPTETRAAPQPRSGTVTGESTGEAPPLTLQPTGVWQSLRDASKCILGLDKA